MQTVCGTHGRTGGMVLGTTKTKHCPALPVVPRAPRPHGRARWAQPAWAVAESRAGTSLPQDERAERMD